MVDVEPGWSDVASVPFVSLIFWALGFFRSCDDRDEDEGDGEVVSAVAAVEVVVLVVVDSPANRLQTSHLDKVYAPTSRYRSLTDLKMVYRKT